MTVKHLCLLLLFDACFFASRYKLILTDVGPFVFGVVQFLVRGKEKNFVVHGVVVDLTPSSVIAALLRIVSPFFILHDPLSYLVY